MNDQSGNLNGFTAIVLAIVIFGVLTIVSSLLYAWALMLFWDWFSVPLLAALEIDVAFEMTYSLAILVYVPFVLIKALFSSVDKSNNLQGETPIEVIWYLVKPSIVKPVVVITFGFLLKITLIDAAVWQLGL